LGIPADAPVIGTVCNLRPQKALDVMLSAVASLRPKLPDCRLLIVGDGVEREGLEALAEQLGLADAVTFLGQRDDIPDVLAAFDLFALSSDFEGMPLAVIEAMGAGLPVAATRVGGIPDLIDDGVQGLLVPARDAGALASAMGELLSAPDLSRRLGEAGRARRQEEFDIDVVVSRVERLYEELAGISRGAGA
jgi:glycosyltransferase involved in cell wall biosynthesis